MGSSHSSTVYTWDEVCKSLTSACADGKPNLVEELLKKYKCDISCVNTCGTTPLHIACLRSNLGVVDLLLTKYRCDVNRVNYYGLAPLHFACESLSPEIVKKLIKYKCDINRCDRDGNTALHVACSRGSTHIAQILLASNCNVDAINSRGDRPLNIAVRSWDLALVKLLVEAGCKLNYPVVKDFLGRGHASSLPQIHNEISKWAWKEFSPIMYLLVQAGHTVGREKVFHMLDSVIKNLLPRTLDRNKVFFEWLRDISQQPPTLLQSCRLVIRDSLGYQPQSKIDQLEVPQTLKWFLKFSDLSELDVII